MSRYEEFEELRKKGLTYKEIAQEKGVSRQYVAQTCQKYNGGASFRAYKVNECVYDGLRRWLNENRITRRLLMCIIADTKAPGGNWHINLKLRLQGKTGFKQAEIDRLIDRSGMTYEQLFRSGRWRADGQAESG